MRVNRMPLNHVPLELVSTYCFNVLLSGPEFVPSKEDFAAFCVLHKRDMLAGLAAEPQGLRHLAFQNLQLPL